jgi:protein SCO1/2
MEIHQSSKIGLQLLMNGPIIEPFSLLNQLSEPTDESIFDNKYTLLFFGFTFCPDICPITLAHLANTNFNLSANEEIQTIFVTVDPSRDSSEKINAYLNNFSHSFIGLTGEESALKNLWSQLGIAVHQINNADGANYNVTHSGVVFLISPTYQIIGIVSNITSPADIEQPFKELISRHKEI